jgi:hypothetical protein
LVQERSAHQSAKRAMAAMDAPTTRKGLRRPQRVWVLSERCPRIGSVRPSISLGKTMAKLTREALMPKPMVKMLFACP